MLWVRFAAEEMNEVGYLDKEHFNRSLGFILLPKTMLLDLLRAW